MNVSDDILRKALRRTECRWVDCEAILSSYELLEKHYAKVHTIGTTSKNRSRMIYECQVRPTKTKLCNSTFDTPEELVEHIVKSHHLVQMWICPSQDCRTNLRRFKTDDDLTDHLDTHATPGGPLPQAILTPIISSRLPPIPNSNQPPYKFLSSYCSPATFTHGKLVKAKRDALNITAIDPTRAVSYVLETWIAAEEDDSLAESKRRQIRLSRGTTIRPKQKYEHPFMPPRFSGVVPRAPQVSVGFDSPGFHKLAQEAFAIVQAEGSDEEIELGSPIAKPEPISDVELDSE